MDLTKFQETLQLKEGDLEYAATVTVFNDDVITFFVLGKSWHREFGPAYTKHDRKTGVVFLEEYLQNNKLHRIDGPAVIQRDRVSGDITEEMYYLNGRRLSFAKFQEMHPS